MPCFYRKLSKGIRWYWKFDFNSKTYFSKCIFYTKKEAQVTEREKYKALDEERRFGKQDKPLFIYDAIQERIKFLSAKYSQSHKINSEYYLNLFVEFFGEVDIRDITRKDIQDFLIDYSRDLMERKLDNYQVNAALKTVKAMFNYIIANYDLVIKNPCNNIKPFSIKKKLKFIPSDEEIEKVLGQVNDRQKLLIKFVMETGCWINEALNLTFEDIKEDYLVLFTKKSVNSNKVPRKVPVPECLKDLTGTGRVFPEWNERPKFLDHILRDKKMKIWGWHNLRHRYASLLSKQNKPLFEVMNLLGHSSINTTQIYLQLLS
jgi:integrase